MTMFGTKADGTPVSVRGNDDGSINVNVVDGGVAGANVVHGGKNVAVTNTAIAIGTGEVDRVVVCANSTNNNSIFVGGSTVAATYGAATSGYELQPGQAVGLLIDNLTEVYINGTAGDGISFIGN